VTEFEGTARSAAWLALALLAAAWPGSPASPAACTEPRDAESRFAGSRVAESRVAGSGDAGSGGGRWTRAVVCGGGADTPVRGPARRLFGLGLDANATDASTLETLSGIGPARARALVEARLEQRFCRARDLERAEGIGPRIRAAISAEMEFPEDCGPTSGEAPPGRESW
jgi:hypothetical protein